MLSVEWYSSSERLGDSRDFVSHVKSLSETEGLAFQVDTENHYLVIDLPHPVPMGEEFTLRTVSVAHPTENILEGIYFDYTPDGAPRTMITQVNAFVCTTVEVNIFEQCQQYGFQRIVPCIDKMDAKTFYTTTIIADTRYSNLISNGDLAPEFCEAGLPRYKR